MLDVSENSLGRWIKDDGWKDLRAAQTASVGSIIARNLRAIEKIHQAAEDEDRALTDNEADRIAKLSASMSKLDKSIDPSTRWQVLYDFLLYYKTRNADAAIACSKVMPDYVNHVMKNGKKV